AALLLAALIVIAPRSGEPAPDPAREARTEFEAGRKYFLQGQYAEALPHLERAYQLSNKRPSAIQALAQCERALGHYPRAIELFREYLATTPRPADASAIEKTIALLEEKLKIAPNVEAGRSPER